jgi:hypothetical protein
MADYAKWSEKEVPVTALLLDPQNPRIPPSGSAMDQRALIAELVEHEGVLELAKDIAADGYAPVESLIGLLEDGKTYILEGNRRLAALKLLLSPETAPQAVISRVRGLSQRANHETLRKVRVLYAPSREASAPLLMRKHTREQIEKWSPVMQARFYRTLSTGGSSASDIAERYGSTPGKVAEFLRLESAYDLACRIELPDATRAKIHDPRKFVVSTLQRILDTPKARDALGIEFDDNGMIAGRVHPDDFKRAYARILADIASEKINTRTTNKKEDVERYLSQIEDVLPDKKKKGSFTLDDFKGPTTQPKSKPTPAPKRTTRKRPRSASLIPSGTACRLSNERINEIFDELRKLKLEKHPNASAVLFRILLELSIGHYLDKTKKIQPLLAAAQAKGKAGDWYPTLRQMLDAMLKDTSISLPTLAKKGLNKLVSDRSSPLSVDGLDSYVHNRFTPPTERELRHYWDLFEDLFEVVLNEPAAPPKGASPLRK